MSVAIVSLYLVCMYSLCLIWISEPKIWLLETARSKYVVVMFSRLSVIWWFPRPTCSSSRFTDRGHDHTLVSVINWSSSLWYVSTLQYWNENISDVGSRYLWSVSTSNSWNGNLGKRTVGRNSLGVSMRYVPRWCYAFRAYQIYLKFMESRC